MLSSVWLLIGSMTSCRGGEHEVSMVLGYWLEFVMRRKGLDL